tara:strand:- start:64 stop:309 length:246 start_codon:yes stop_codon:yes gene_type:complete
MRKDIKAKYKYEKGIGTHKLSTNAEKAYRYNIEKTKELEKEVAKLDKFIGKRKPMSGGRDRPSSGLKYDVAWKVKKSKKKD